MFTVHSAHNEAVRCPAPRLQCLDALDREAEAALHSRMGTQQSQQQQHQQNNQQSHMLGASSPPVVDVEYYDKPFEFLNLGMMAYVGERLAMQLRE